MISHRSKLTLFLVLLLLFSRMGALVHASEHIFEHDHEYCEICSLSDNQSDGLIDSSGCNSQKYHLVLTTSYFTHSLPVILSWDSLPRAPPVSSVS